MVDVGLWIKNANIQARCGINANATAKAVAATDVYVLDVENYINCLCKVKITAAIYAALGTDIKYMLMDLGANICAMIVISQDMDAIGRSTAQTMLDFLQYRISAAEKIITDSDKQLFMGLT